MLMRSPHAIFRFASDERGAVLVIATVVLATLLVVATYAIDTGIWFVHHRHLQTEADAAALAAGQNFQYPCTAGGAMDEAIARVVHEYDGTAGTYNQQVPVSPTPSSSYSSTQHNLISEIDQANFVNQSEPGDGGLSGSPCTDGVIDVKLSETNLSSFFPFFSPKYINAQARVSILQASAGSGAEPLAIPSPAPSSISATLVNESTGTTLAGPLKLKSSSNGTTWTAPAQSVTFPSSNVAVGLRVAVGTGPSCGQQLECYDSGSQHGIAYTRVWSNSGSPGLPLNEPVAPQAKDVTLGPASSSGCPNAPSGTFSNFISSSSACSVQASANMTFTSEGGTSLACATTSLTLKAGASSVSMSCPQKGPNGVWVSPAVSIAANAGPVEFAIEYAVMAGKLPKGATGGTKGECGDGKSGHPKPCTGSLGVVQRTFTGAYDEATASSSRSGPITGATVVDAKTGGELMSLESGKAKEVEITVTTLDLGFKNSTTITTGKPIVLHTAGSQGTYAIQCGPNNGSSSFDKQMDEGCSEEFATTTEPNPPICSNQPPGPAVCVNQNPGNGKIVEPGINERINGSQNATKCVNPNRWVTSNTLGQILAQQPKDPRLVHLLIVDSSAWVGVTGSNFKTPVRYLATFYVTGWSRSGKSADPCTSGPGISNGLSYTSDDNPGAGVSNVLLGHFVKYVDASSTGTGSGKCSESSFGDCIAVLTR